MSGQADSAGRAMDRKPCGSWDVTERELKMSVSNMILAHGGVVSSVAISTGIERDAE